MLKKIIIYGRTFADKPGEQYEVRILASIQPDKGLATATILTAVELPRELKTIHAVPIRNGETGAMAKAIEQLNGLCPDL